MSLLGAQENGSHNVNAIESSNKNKYTRINSELAEDHQGLDRAKTVRKYVLACAFFASLNSVLLGYGSLLIGRIEAELDQLKRRVQLLSAAGIRAEFLHSNDLATKEPELEVGQESGAAFLPDDCQLDAYRIEKGNHLFESQGRYAEFCNDPAVCFLRSEAKGNIEGISGWEGSLALELKRSNSRRKS